MIKTHNLTNLKYLCKTSTKDPFKPYKYLGSGKYWKRHLNKHGRDVATKILEICKTRKELTKKGIYYSKLYDVVNSKEFANIIEERGDGGPTMLGRRITPAQNRRKSIALQRFHANKTETYIRIRNRINVMSHALGDNTMYITPAGEFLTCSEASKANNLSAGSIKNHCIRGHNNDIVDSRRMGRDLFMKKTWKEVGYDLRPLTTSEIEKHQKELDLVKQQLRLYTEGAIPDY